MKRTHSVAAAAVVALGAMVACQPADDQGAPGAETDTMPPPGMGADTMGAAAPAEGGGQMAATALEVDTLENAGPYLVDNNGRALYLFTADQEGASECQDACAEAWPPFVVEDGEPNSRSTLVDTGLIGTIERQDGTTQVTYGGHPLYYFQRDAGPGETQGQDVEGFGGEWYLVQPSGEPLESETANGDTPPA